MGPVERAVRSDIVAAVCAAPMGEALAELAYALAAMIDDPSADAAHRSPAGIAKELRAILELLAAATVSDNDDDLARLLSGATGLSTEVRNTPQP